MRRLETFDYNGSPVTYRETWGDVAARWLGLTVTVAVALIPVAVLSGVAPRWFWLLF